MDTSTGTILKINVDGAIFQQLKASGVVVVIRDSAGRIEAALSKQLHMPLVPLAAEAMAMTERVRFAWEVRIRDAVFECGSKIVYDAILGYFIPPIAIDNVIVGIRQQMEAFRMIKSSSS